MPIDILFVDDEHSWREGTKYYIEGTPNINLDFADSYASALKHIRQKKYDLIVSDGLEGDCFRIFEDIKNMPHGDFIIFSGSTGDNSIESQAEEQKIPFYSKAESTKFLDGIIAKYAPSKK